MITPNDEVFLLNCIMSEISRRTQAGFFKPDELKGIGAMKLLLTELMKQSKNKGHQMVPLSGVLPTNEQRN